MTKVIFMGTPDFAVPILRTLIEDGYDVAAVVTQPDRPVGRKRILTPPPVKKRKSGIFPSTSLRKSVKQQKRTKSWSFPRT